MMAKRMSQIPRTEFEPRGRTERHEFLLRRQELERFMASQSQNQPDNFSSRRESRAARWSLLKRRAATFVEDLSLYLDLCLARFIVRRELRLKNKPDTRQ